MKNYKKIKNSENFKKIYGKIEKIWYNKYITRERIQSIQMGGFNMVEDLKVVEMNEELKEKTEKVKESEKEAILKEYEDTLGY